MRLLHEVLGRHDDPERPVARGGRMAAIAFLGGALFAVPVNLLIGEGPELVLLPLMGLVSGLVCLVLPWERMPMWSLHLAAAAGILEIALSAALAHPAYAIYFVFVALFIAIVFHSPRVVAAHLTLVTLGLAAAVLFSEHSSREVLILALIEAPTLILVTVVASYMTGRLEYSRRAYRTMSRVDPLTGVGNYRALQDRLRAEIARSRRTGRPFGLVLIDLDGFKQINERHGHLLGDRVLARVGAELAEAMRGSDSVFRQGGDEFAAIATELDPGALEPLLDRLQEAVTMVEAGVAIRASLGGAVFPLDADAGDRLYAIADARLFTAKKGGPPVSLAAIA